MSTTPLSRKAYPTDVTDAEWAWVAPYLTLLDEDALQRRYPVREVFNALRWMVRAGAPWRLLPTKLPTLADRLSTSAALDGRRLLRGAGPRSAPAAASGAGAQRAAVGGDLRRPRAPIES